MTLVATMASGFLLGLAYFGGLWLSVRRLLRGRRRSRVLAAGKVLRLGLFGVAVVVLSRHTGAYTLGILPGVWLARWCVVCSLKEARRGQ